MPNTYTRPFGPEAPWNIPISGLERDPDSAQLSELLWTQSSDRPGNFNLNNTAYTYPVYEAVANTRFYPVVDLNGWGNLGGTRIPFDPSWKPAPGTDAQMIILDPATGREWDLWQVKFDGTSVIVSNGNLIAGQGGSDSYFDRDVGFGGSRGVGIPYLAMLVRPEEVAQGRIEHALSMPIRNTSGAEYVAPATKLEYPGVRPDGIPEGTRFALDVTYAEIDAHLASLPGNLSDVTISSLRTIMVALKEYGWFITDTAGSAHLQLESTTSALDEWAALGLVDSSASGKVYPRDALDGLMTAARIYAIVPSNQYASDAANESPSEPDSYPPVVIDVMPDDNDNDGSPGPAGATFRVEAEDAFTGSGFLVQSIGGAASGGKVIQPTASGTQTASYKFAGAEGKYDIKIAYFDENDGISNLAIRVDGVEVDSWQWNRDLGSKYADLKTATNHVIADIEVAPGDRIELVGKRDSGEALRLDYVEFVWKGGAVSEGPDREKAFLRVEAEDAFRGSGFAAQSIGSAASGGKVLQTSAPGSQTAGYDFAGPDGVYDIKVAYFDENDGRARLAIRVDGVEVDSWRWNQDLGSKFADQKTATTRLISGVEIESGDRVELVGAGDAGEPLRIDYIEFNQLDTIL